VIGNELHKRKIEVVFVERTQHGKGTGDERVKGAQTPPLSGGAAADPFVETWLRLPELAKGRTDDVEIEEFIISQLLERHNQWIATGAKA
jgi:phosphopantothenate-cysteine ligase